MSRSYRSLPPRAGLSLFIAATLGACGLTEPRAPAEITALPRQLSQVEQQIVTGTSHFAFGLLREEAARNAGRNVFISPLSASFALGMAANGSTGSTFDAMSGLLGFGGATHQAMAQSYQSLLELLTGLDPQVRMQIANSVWYHKDFSVLPSFLDESRRHFGARVSALDFNAPSSVTTINAWVAENTNGRITRIVESIPPDLVMYLINAVYFKGSWRERFEVARTRQEEFTRENGTPVTVPMMHRDARTRYFENASIQAVDLGYGGDAFTMTILLPRTGTARQLVASLDTATWRNVRTGLHASEVDLAMPRYRIEFKDSLVRALKALGMTSGFCDQPASFSRIALGALCISVVDQKTFVEVNEEGTEAAAVTSVGIMPVSAPPRRMVRVDQPFVVVLSERLSGTILFAGLILDPSS